MPSFDIVSEINAQEVDNAVNQAQKEIASRYDFKSIFFEIGWDKEKNSITLNSESQEHITALLDVLGSKLNKRGIDLSALEYGKKEPTGGNKWKQVILVKQGLEQEKSKQIVKLIKETKLKVEASIQGEQVRVTAKKIDDLQQIISFLKTEQPNLKIPMQFVNMRS
jgi:cyclic-di-GMP-binding protein